MTEEKKTEEKSEEDWGVEKPKSGIAIETKVGLCLICILLSAFGLVVYQKINRPQEELAVNSPAEETTGTESETAPDPFAEGATETEQPGQVASQTTGFESGGDSSGFSTPQENQGQNDSFGMQDQSSAETDQFAQNDFGNQGGFTNQSEPSQSNAMAANQSDNGFQQFDQPVESNNEFGNTGQNDFQTGGMQNQAEPATFDNAQQDPFAGGDQFAQSNTGMQQGASQQNAFDGAGSEFTPPAAGNDSGLMEQPAANEFAQADAGTQAAVQVEEDPFGAATTEPTEAMPRQPEPAAGNEFDSFDSVDNSNPAQMQNPEEFSEKPAKVNITEISSPSDADPFGNAGFGQAEPQTQTAQMENANEFGNGGGTTSGQEFEQPQVSEFNETETSQGEERFGDFRAEEFSAQQAESVTTVKRPAATIDAGTFSDTSMPAEPAPQAQGLFDSPAPTPEVSTQEFGSLQEESFSQQTSAPVGGEYVVQNGENFWTISKKLYGSGRYFQLLARINKSRVSDPRKMRPGLKLIAPDQASIEAQYQASHKTKQTTVSEFSGSNTVRKTGKPSGFFISGDGKPMYRVGSNDTLTDISQRHLGRSSRWFQIYQINRQKLQNPNKLKIGTELQLPYDASRVSLVPGNGSSR